MLRRNERKPLYYNKRKAAKEIEQEFVSELEEASFTDTQSEFHRPVLRRKNRYEYSEFDDNKGNARHRYPSMHSINNRYTTDNSFYNMEHDVDEYTSQWTEYNEPIRQKYRNDRSYGHSEIESCDDSDSECKICSNGVKYTEKKSAALKGLNDYPSEYSYRQPNKYKSIKNDHKINREKREIYTDTETIPYRHDVNQVYLARPPVGHRAFRYQEKEIEDIETSSEEEEETDGNVPVKDKKVSPPNNSQYHVYAAEVPQSPQGVFNQGVRERLLSVTNYDASVPMMALKDNNKTDKVIKSDSGIVYLPVIVLDQAIKLSKNKVVSPEILLANAEDKIQRPLETQMQIYAAIGTNQENIFQKEKKQQGDDVKEVRFPQETVSYPINQISGNPIKSEATRATVENKANNDADYPVNKSYINVVSPKSSSTKVKKSKSKLKKVFSMSSFKSLFGRSSEKGKKKTKKGAKAKNKKNKLRTKRDDELNETTLTDTISQQEYSILTRNNTNDDKQMWDAQQKPNMSNITKSILNNNESDDVMAGNTLPPNIGQGIEDTRYENKKITGLRNSLFSAKVRNSELAKKSVGDRKSLVDEKRKSIPRQSESKPKELRKSVIEEKRIREKQSIAEGRTSVFEAKPSIFGSKPSIIGSKPSIFGSKPSTSGDNQNTIANRNLIGERKSVMGDKQPKHGDTWKSEPNIKPIRGELSTPSSERIYKTEAKEINTEKKSLPSQIIHYDHKKSITIDEAVEMIPLSQTNQHANIVQVHEKIPYAKSNYSLIKRPSVTEQPQYKTQRKSSKTLKKKSSIKELDDNTKPEQHFWGYNICFTTYIFQSVQFFLGASLHDLLMEVSHNYTH